MYKNTFKMVAGDTVADRDLVLVDGQEELRQNVENRLSVNSGEWFLNIDLGLDYEAISGKGVTGKDIDFAIRECCLQDDWVKEVKEVKVTRQAEERRTEIDILIIDKGQEEVWLKEMVDLGQLQGRIMYDRQCPGDRQ